MKCICFVTERCVNICDLVVMGMDILSREGGGLLIVTRASGHFVDQVHSMSPVVLKAIECKLELVPLNLTFLSAE